MIVHTDNTLPRSVCLQRIQAGLLAFESSRSLRLPMKSNPSVCSHSDIRQSQSSITAAGPRRIPRSPGHRLPFSFAPAILKATNNRVEISRTAREHLKHFNRSANKTPRLRRYSIGPDQDCNGENERVSPTASARRQRRTGPRYAGLASAMPQSTAIHQELMDDRHSHIQRKDLYR